MIIDCKLFDLDNQGQASDIILLQHGKRHTASNRLLLLTMLFQRFSEFPRWLRIILLPDPFAHISRLIFGANVFQSMSPIEIFTVGPSVGLVG